MTMSTTLNTLTQTSRSLFSTKPRCICDASHLSNIGQSRKVASLSTLSFGGGLVTREQSGSKSRLGGRNLSTSSSTNSFLTGRNKNGTSFSSSSSSSSSFLLHHQSQPQFHLQPSLHHRNLTTLEYAPPSSSSSSWEDNWESEFKPTSNNSGDLDLNLNLGGAPGTGMDGISGMGAGTGTDQFDPAAEGNRIEMTDSARERLQRVMTNESNPHLCLRITVESGGCHGYQYKMDLEDRPTTNSDDYIFIAPPSSSSSTDSSSSQQFSPRIIVDPVSYDLVKGATLDYATELIGSSFRIVDNPQAKGSGCGCGVSWELKEP